MAVIKANGITIEYEFHGVRNNPVVMLVHGLGMPLSAWPENMINLLVSAGYCVLRYDNRDTGRSEKFDHLPMPNVPWHFTKLRLGLKPKPPYPLDYLRQDAVALMDVLNLNKVHVVGVSMGGMIAQLISINAPHRVKSLTSIMSTTGNRKLPGPDKDVSRHLMSKPKSSSPEDVMAFHVKTWQLIGSPAYPTDVETIKKAIAINLEHGMSATGTLRQMLAIMSAPDRVKQLRLLEVPSLVIHGKADPLIKFEAALDMTNAIRNAKLFALEGMGHNLPEPLLPQIVQQIVDHARANN